MILSSSSSSSLGGSRSISRRWECSSDTSSSGNSSVTRKHLLVILGVLIHIMYLPEKSPIGQMLDDKWIRNCITNDVIGRIPNDMETRDFMVTVKGPKQKNDRHESAKERKQSFRNIYKHKIWGSDNERLSGSGISGSGKGSFTRGCKIVYRSEAQLTQYSHTTHNNVNKCSSIVDDGIKNCGKN